MTMGYVLGLLGVATAVILAGIGSAIGIGTAGMAASGAMSEDPKKFGKYLLLIALPGTQGIYGFIISFLAFGKLGAISGDAALYQGLSLFLACQPIAWSGLFSAIWQGKVCAGGVGMTSKQPNESGKAMVMAVFVEFYAVLGLIISIFALG
jgi:V/A-type H+-transporting ATPase subunit K